VRCERVSKRYRLRQRRKPASGGLRARLTGGTTIQTDFWALQDVSFEVARGETLGVVGRNGAGKSTLLKLLGGITAPTEGEITLTGRLAAMIEVGSGFHPELTGRENVFLSGAILGMRRREIAARLDSIADFSGVAAFLDTPVKFYSSGMYVRLGFAIAAHLHADILLVDEVLAVGDAEFQARCMQRMQELKRNGTTMLLVSHDLGAIEQLSDQSIMIDGGRVTVTGSPHDVVSRYQRLVSGPDALPTTELSADETSSAQVSVTALTIHGADGGALVAAVTGEPLEVRVTLRCRTLGAIIVRLSFYDFDKGTLLTECLATLDPLAGSASERGEVVLHFLMPGLLLGPGTYTLGVTATLEGAPKPVAWRFGRTTLYVHAGEHAQLAGGVFTQPFRCRVTTPGPASLEVVRS
jgi:lipopolysaccharide transport system ATP-binding protein